MCNQKGGTGSSTIIPLCACLFVREHRLKVLVIDTHDQKSIFNKRKREIKEAPEEDVPYPVKYCTSKDIISCITALNEEFDIILIDWSGRISLDPYLERLLFICQMVLVPIVAGDFNTLSTFDFLDYIKAIHKRKKALNMDSELYGFLNMYNDRYPRHRELRSIANEKGIPLLRSSIRNSVEYQRLWSTITPLSKARSKIAQKEVMELTDEIIGII
jgi:cellulose biosynthesis protein BcsQ